MKLDEFNQLSDVDATYALLQCCTSTSWAEKVATGRPYTNVSLLERAADMNWRGLNETDYLQAFEGHPQIGNMKSLRAKYSNTKALARGEQSEVKQANEDELTALSQGNKDYLSQFGFIFIVCATGKSAGQMLALLQSRLPNDRSTEVRNAAEEQRKIFHIRLAKMILEKTA
ncbi:MAG: 2-oxo-4-hydroxy-4-carboxy-5-ureidoimidazoline decarboxylase [Alteromonadaceae bacterium]|jgi:2-oxo-4-hydroxy-4-carboxy-5-ureidoimidazoline decarboxylase